MELKIEGVLLSGEAKVNQTLQRGQAVQAFVLTCYNRREAPASRIKKE
jgi:hypothetical protein